MQLVIEATACTDRSMPPIMMTRVTPDAMRNSVMVSAVTDRKLLTEKNVRS